MAGKKYMAYTGTSECRGDIGFMCAEMQKHGSFCELASITALVDPLLKRPIARNPVPFPCLGKAQIQISFALRDLKLCMKV